MSPKKHFRTKTIIFLGLGVLLFFIFIVFSFLVHKDIFTQNDFDTTVVLQDNIGRNWDREFSWFSEIGKFEISSLVLLSIVGFYVINFRQNRVLIKRILAGLSAILLFIGFHVIELYGKFFVNHPPPPEFMLRTEHLFDFPQFHVRSEFSYPSGHAGRAVFLAVILIALLWQSKKLSKKVKIALVLVITCYNAVMLISRVYLGEHWTSDVIGGALLGGGLGFLAVSLLFSTFRKSITKPESIKKK